MSFHGDFIKHQYVLRLLRACSRAPSLKSTKSLHALAVTTGSTPAHSVFFYNNIMSQYLSCGELFAARKMFDTMPQPNVVSYSTIIGGYSRSGFIDDAWNLISNMRARGFVPTQFTFGGLLSSESLNLTQGVQLHALIEKSGLFNTDAFVGTSLLGLYGRHGYVREAVQVFDEMPWKSLVTGNVMLSLFGHNELVEECMLLFRELLCCEAALSEYSFVGVLSGFSCEQHLEYGQQIHGLVIKKGFDYQVLIVNSLINMYVKCADLWSAEKVFDEVLVRDVVSWNTIIGAVAKSETPGKALKLFRRMSMDGVLPSQTTFVSVINSCGSLESPLFGECIHGKIILNAFELKVFVGTALVDFYAKFDKLEEAQCCFNEIMEKNVVSWNALVLGYSNNCSSTSMYLVREMLHLGFTPNEVTFSAVLKSLLFVEIQQLHCLIIRLGYEESVYILTSLASSYAKNGLISDARVIIISASNSWPSVVPSNIMAGIYNRTGQYDETIKSLCLLEEPDVVSWNIVMAASARKNEFKDVFELFKHMRSVLPIHHDNYSFVTLLSVCARQCNLALGSSVHGLIIKTDFRRCDTFVCNVMIDMYGKCGNVGSSAKLFEKVKERNIITWTALISSLGINGYAREALERFREMELMGFKPDGVALSAVLTACRHGGLVREGMKLFGNMKQRYGVEPEMDHYHCVVDLLARLGHVAEAGKVIAAMPFPPNALIWRSFLDGCKRQRTL